jgi:HEAT repeat protein
LLGVLNDDNKLVRGSVAKALGRIFSQIPDKNKDQAWQDLHMLIQDEVSDVRREAARALGFAFSHFPKRNRDQAWQDLHMLTQDEADDVRMVAAEALGTVIPDVSDPSAILQDLIRLTQDKNSEVQMFAYHSLGRASIFRATETDNEAILKRELESAVTYFEKSSQIGGSSNPSKFCHPFYRTFLAITFQEPREYEIQRYLSEAKESIADSQSKKELLNAVENLALALQESKRLKHSPVRYILEELSAYRWYCENAAKHITEAEDKAPGAVKFMKKCSPIIEDRILDTIEEIQEKAKQVCQVTHGKGEAYETLGIDINKSASSLSLDDLAKTQRCISRIAMQLKEFCRLLPPGKKELVCEAIKEVSLV